MSYMRKNGLLNLMYVAWFAFYFLLFWLLFGASAQSFKMTGYLYGISLVVSFLPVSEKLMRFFQGMRPIQTNQEKEKLLSIFEDVYENAKEVNPGIFKNIELYVQDNMNINAYAMGRNTLVVTKGALELMDDKELHGLIGHELGHFSNGDTLALLVMMAGNFVFTFFCKMFYWFTRFGDIIMMKTQGVPVMSWLWWIVSTIVNFITFIGDAILMPISRRNEYLADKFAYSCGYGEELTRALYKLTMLANEKPKSIKEYVRSTHPSLTSRIERLETLSEQE